MAERQRTAIVTGASRGIGAGLVEAFLRSGYRVVANALHFSGSEPTANGSVARVAGDISLSSTAEKIAETAKSKFGSIDALVNNAGIFFSKPFTEYTVEDLRALSAVNLEGFLFITQLAIKEMLAQKSGGSIVNITSTMVEHPIAGSHATVPMMTKGGLQAVTRSLAMEYVKEGIRVNAVAPGVVDTPMHTNDPKEQLEALQPMGKISSVKDIVDAVMYLTEAGQVTGEILHVDGGAHVGKW